MRYHRRQCALLLICSLFALGACEQREGPLSDAPGDRSGLGSTAQGLAGSWSWVKDTISPLPTGDHQFGMVETLPGQAFVYGGLISASATTSDNWLWNGAEWIDQTPVPLMTGINSPGNRYDPATVHLGDGQVLIFGGTNTADPPGKMADTWLWTGSEWQQLSPSTVPPARKAASIVALGNGQALLFGGIDLSISPNITHGDTWKWTGDDWEQLDLPVAPPGRDGAIMAEVTPGRFLLYGGRASRSPARYLNDTWEWLDGRWVERFPEIIPDVVFGCSAVSTGDGHVLVIGGQSATGVKSTAIWDWDGFNWTKRLPQGSEKPTDLTFGGAFEEGGRIYYVGRKQMWHTDLPSPIYPVTVQGSAGGTLLCTPDEVIRGDSVACAAVPQGGYALESVSCLPGPALCPTTLEGATAFQVASVQGPVTVRPSWRATPHTVTVIDAPGGNVSCSPATVNHGGSTSCTFTPEPGNSLIALNCVGALCPGVGGLASPFSVGPVMSDLTVSPLFAPLVSRTFGISASGQNGAVLCAPPTVTAGGSTTCTVVAEGYQLSDLNCTGVMTSRCPAVTPGVSSFTLKGISTDITLALTFARSFYPVATLDDGNGSLTCVPNPVEHGATVACSIAPNPGHSLTSLTCTGATCPSTLPTGAFLISDVEAPLTVQSSFSLVQHSVTVGPHTNGTLSCTSVVAHGGSATCTFSASPGYSLRGLGCAGIDCPAASSLTSPFELGAIERDVVIAPIFAQNDHFAISINARQGSLSCNPNPALAGEPITCLVIPESGYVLGYLGCAGSMSSACPNTEEAGTSFTITGIASDLLLNARFEKVTYPISITSAANGEVLCAPSDVPTGESSSCAVVPTTGYELIELLCTGAICPTPAVGLESFKLSEISEPVTITPTFGPRHYTLSVVEAEHGAIVCSPTTIEHGGAASCTISPIAGFKLHALACAGVACPSAVGLVSPFDIRNIVSDGTLIPVFGPVDRFAIGINAHGGSIVCAPNPVEAGAESICTAAPLPGHVLENLACEGTMESECPAVAEAADGFTLSGIGSELLLTASFSKQRYPIVVNTTGSGAVQCVPTSVEHGGFTLCTVAPDAGSALTALSCTDAVCPAAAPSLPPFALTNITAPVTLDATFAARQYTVTVIGAPNGTMSCDSPVAYGAQSQCTFTANENYVLGGLLCAGATCPALPTSPFTLTNLSQDATLTPIFVRQGEHAISTNATHGTLVCVPTAIPEGGETTCTATPAAGYQRAALKCSGTMSTSCPHGSALDAPFTLSGIESNIALTATFPPALYTISIATVPGGSVSCAPTSIALGGSAICTIAPEAGQLLTGLTCLGANCPDAASALAGFPVTNPTAPIEITPAFGPLQLSVTVLSAEHGTMACEPLTVAYGESTSCTFTPEEEYALAALACAGLNCPAAANLTSPFMLGPIVEASTVAPIFRQAERFYVSVTAQGGSVSCNPNPVEKGGTTSCAVAPAEGFLFTSLQCEGTMAESCPEPASAAMGFTLTGIESDLLLTALFERELFAITIAQAQGGHISCRPASVELGGSALCTVAAETGYALSALTCAGTFDGSCAEVTPSTQSFVLTAVSSPIELTPYFVPKEYPVTALSIGEGGIFECPATVAHGEQLRCTFQATPPARLLALACVGVQCPPVAGLASPIDFDGVTGPVAITASFGVVEHPCASHEDCMPDGYCDFASGNCAPRKENSEPCAEPGECVSGACDTDRGQCSPCGASAPCAAEQYCDLESGDCKPKKEAQEPCASDTECVSNRCDPATQLCGERPCAQTSDCPPGATCTDGECRRARGLSGGGGCDASGTGLPLGLLLTFAAMAGRLRFGGRRARE